MTPRHETIVSRLTPYALAHLRMADISKRFETVIARHPEHHPQWRVNMAREIARRQFDNFPSELSLFEFHTRKGK